MLIRGNQVCLRDYRMDDLEHYAYWMQPQHTWHQYDGPYYPKATSDEIATQMSRIRARIAAGNWPDPRTRLVIADTKTAVMLGMVSWYWIGQETHWAALGIAIYDTDCWGRGIGYEAFGLWNDYLFQAFPEWARLDLRTWSGNVGMMKLAQKLGYMEEARFRKARIVKGQYYDGMGYGILREEWQSLYPDGFAAHLHHLMEQ